MSLVLQSNRRLVPGVPSLRRWRRLWQRLGLGAAAAIAIAGPVRAAEKVYFAVGPLDFDVSVASLETFAKTGAADADLRYYLRYFSPRAQSDFREALNAAYPTNPVAVAQSFYEPMGETLLQSVGALIQTESRQNGFYALRAALIQAAADPQGLTVLGVIRRFPGRSIRLDTRVAIATLQRATRAFKETDAVITTVRTLSDAAATTEPPTDFATLPDLRRPGPIKYTLRTLTLHDTSRDRVFPADLYLPETAATTPTPVAIISHGLGSSRKNFADLAQYLASYGYAVALPEHIGSNYDRQQAVLAGKASEVFDRNEFIDRPRDVTFLLNELENLNQTTLQNRLNLKQVAIIGHSFGGYTALVLGGATVDFAHLHKDCAFEELNVSLLLQCRALELESVPAAVALLSQQGLRDPRIQLVIAVNPVNGSILGPRGLSQIQVPVVMGASGYDPAAPVVPEQAQSFTWLTTPEKYLVLAEGASHTAELTELINTIVLQTESAQQFKTDYAIFDSGIRSLALAFLQVYINHRPDYRPYLRASYAKVVSKPPFILSLIRSLTPDQLAQIRQAYR